LSHILRTASPQSLDVKLWRTYRCGDDNRHFAGGKLSRPNWNGGLIYIDSGSSPEWQGGRDTEFVFLTDNRSWRWGVARLVIHRGWRGWRTARQFCRAVSQ